MNKGQTLQKGWKSFWSKKFHFNSISFQDDSVVKDNGKYFSDCRVKEPIHLANNINDQDLLDKLSRKLVGLEEK